MKLSGLTLLMFLATTLPGLKAQNGTKSKKPDLNFRIQAVPSTIDEDKTEEIEVRCDYFGPSTLVSIAIEKRSRTSKDVQTLAHISMNQPKQVVAQNGIKAEQTSGEIKADGQSGYLSIKWSTPRRHQKGLYKCQVVARVEHGQIVKSKRSVRVNAKRINVACLLRILGLLKEEVSTLKEEVGSVKEEVGSVKEEVGSVKGEVGSVKGQVESVRGDIGRVKKFLPSKRYNNRTYYLKLYMPVTQTEAQAFCQDLGGYLAEIDNRAEYDFVAGFVSNLLANYHLILIGGSDSRSEGTWVFHRTNTSVPFFNWASGEPNNAGGYEDCMCLWKVNGQLSNMNDINCNLSIVRGRWEPGFLCEVPE